MDIDPIYYDLVYDFSNSVFNKLEVKRYSDYKQIKNYIRRANIILESAFQDNDPEPIIVSFDTLKQHIIKLNVLQ